MCGDAREQHSDAGGPGSDCLGSAHLEGHLQLPFLSNYSSISMNKSFRVLVPSFVDINVLVELISVFTDLLKII